MNRNDIPDEALEAALRAALYRRDCPDAMALVDYHLGWLTEPEQRRIQTHLARCPYCQVELDRLIKASDADRLVSEKDPGWTKGLDFEWQRLRKTGRVIIRVLAEGLTRPPHLQLAPIPTKGRADAEPANVVRRISLGAEQAGDLEVEAIVYRAGDDPQACILNVRVAVPSRWPDLAGTLVQVRSGNWQAQGATDEAGGVTFRGLPISLIEGLVIEVQPPAADPTS